LAVVPADVGAIQAGIAGSKRVIVTDASHRICREKPEQCSPAVISFIESNSD